MHSYRNEIGYGKVYLTIVNKQTQVFLALDLDLSLSIYLFFF